MIFAQFVCTHCTRGAHERCHKPLSCICEPCVARRWPDSPAAALRADVEAAPRWLRIGLAALLVWAAAALTLTARRCARPRLPAAARGSAS